MYFDQSEFDLRLEWGLNGLLALQSSSDAVVIVDVLSFSTAVDIAVSNGASILPYRWKDDGAERFALENGAVLAGGRSVGDKYTLSPASLRSIPCGTALVLPSPNGSTLALSAKGAPVYTACLRNAPAVAMRAASHGPRIAVIAAGERWHDSSLRPCLEDLLGAGAVLEALPGSLSPEADIAVAAFTRFRRDLRGALSRCGSGKELIGRGFELDVALASDYAISNTSPGVLHERFVDLQPRLGSLTT